MMAERPSSCGSPCGDTCGETCGGSPPELSEHDLALLSYVHGLHRQGIRKVGTYLIHRWGPDDVDLYASLCSCIHHGYLAEYRRVYVFLTDLGDYTMRRAASVRRPPTSGARLPRW